MPRLVIEVQVRMKEGLHARPAMMFVDVANQYRCNVTLKKSGTSVDGKSIMHVMTLEAVQGTTLQIEADGEDAHDAISSLKRLFDEQFGED
jgi:phosphocarrier protein HPr